MSTVDAMTGSTASSGSTTTSSRTTLGQDDFYKIMISELSNQDPFEPLDNQQFLEQLTSLQNSQTMSQLNEGIGKLLLSQELASAGNLIGREIKAVDADAAEGTGELSGTVERVQVKDGEVSLVLDGGQPVALGEILEIA
jgi:flagellar basal-body rod modification protein FlgD